MSDEKSAIKYILAAEMQKTLLVPFEQTHHGHWTIEYLDEAAAELKVIEADNASLSFNNMAQREEIIQLRAQLAQAQTEINHLAKGADEIINLHTQLAQAQEDVESARKVIEQLKKCADTSTSWAKRYCSGAAAWLSAHEVKK